MSYQPLARKYRPSKFSDLVGQEAVSKALAGSITLDRLHPSIIFSGVRGIGKTTTARLLAKALNCEGGPTPEPCGDCNSCKAITIGTHEDVLEIDGASNNGVDEVRALRETVSYVPQRSKYKVYIIDEVHMLSTSAFNALLKTLEEPPANVVFIFATTELQKVPQTVIGRCLTFNLKKMTVETITNRIKDILEREGISFEESALQVIAREGRGSMRDALTFLDQVIAIGGGQVSLDAMKDLVSSLSSAPYFEILKSLVQRDGRTCISTVDSLDRSGALFTEVVDELAKYARHSFILKDLGEDSLKQSLLGLNDEELISLREIISLADPLDLNRIFRTLMTCRADLDGSDLDRYVFENYLLEWCFDPGLPNIDALLSSSGKLNLSSGSSGSGATQNSGNTENAPRAKVRLRLDASASVLVPSSSNNSAPTPNPVVTETLKADIKSDAKLEVRLEAESKIESKTENQIEEKVSLDVVETLEKKDPVSEAIASNTSNDSHNESGVQSPEKSEETANKPLSKGFMAELRKEVNDASRKIKELKADVNTSIQNESDSTRLSTVKEVGQISKPSDKPSDKRADASSAPAPIKPAPLASDSENQSHSAPSIVADSTSQKTDEVNDSFPETWRDLVDVWKRLKPLQARKLEEVHPIKYSPSEIVVAVDEQSMVGPSLLQAATQKHLEKVFSELFGFSGRFRAVGKKTVKASILESNPNGIQEVKISSSAQEQPASAFEKSEKNKSNNISDLSDSVLGSVDRKETLSSEKTAVESARISMSNSNSQPNQLPNEQPQPSDLSAKPTEVAKVDGNLSHEAFESDEPESKDKLKVKGAESALPNTILQDRSEEISAKRDGIISDAKAHGLTKAILKEFSGSIVDVKVTNPALVDLEATNPPSR